MNNVQARPSAHYDAQCNLLCIVARSNQGGFLLSFLFSPIKYIDVLVI